MNDNRYEYICQLAEAGSYWGARYFEETEQEEIDVMHFPVDDPFTINIANDAEAIVDRLLDAKRSYCEQRQHIKYEDIRLRGWLFFELLPLLLDFTPTIMLGGIVAVVGFLPLYMLSGLAEIKQEYNQSSFIVIDLKQLESSDASNENRAPQDENARELPVAPPSPPKFIQ